MHQSAENTTTSTSEVHLDLHTHTWRSGDSSTTFDEYIDALHRSGLRVVAVTDHLTIAEGQRIKEQLGPMIIVGQEFRTHEGECIGLFLTETLPPGLTFAEASARIRGQGGITYVPHPGDLNRRSITFANLHVLCAQGLVDIIEAGNSKINDSSLITTAHEIAQTHGIVDAASSDAHVAEAIGSSYTSISRLPQSGQDLKELLLRGERHYRHFDPPRRWTSQVIPSQSNNT